MSWDRTDGEKRCGRGGLSSAEITVGPHCFTNGNRPPMSDKTRDLEPSSAVSVGRGCVAALDEQNRPVLRCLHVVIFVLIALQ